MLTSKTSHWSIPLSCGRAIERDSKLGRAVKTKALSGKKSHKGGVEASKRMPSRDKAKNYFGCRKKERQYCEGSKK